jgi:energy-converting hydrogenase B subunit D
VAEIFNVILLGLGIVSALIALNAKDLLGATVVLSAFSFIMCLLWAEMGAVDVAFTEAAVGAGVSTVYLIAMIKRTTERTSD